MDEAASARERVKRTRALLGKRDMELIKNARVTLFGLGGVGSYAAEAIARMGVGDITIIDADKVSFSNINRQLPALMSTIGMSKTAVVKARILDINPSARVTAIERFHTPQDPVDIAENTSVVLDAIDTVAAKLHIAAVCHERKLPLISCMGMGNRLDPSLIRVGDIFGTEGCPLCRVMRRELRKRGIAALKCVYSVEKPLAPEFDEFDKENSPGRPAPGSIAFVPPVAGLYMAREAMLVITGRGQ